HQRATTGPARWLHAHEGAVRSGVAARESSVLARQRDGEVRSRRTTLAISCRQVRASSLGVRANAEAAAWGVDWVSAGSGGTPASTLSLSVPVDYLASPQRSTATTPMKSRTRHPHPGLRGTQLGSRSMAKR